MGEKRGFSRRDFFKGAGVVFGGAAAASILGGCSDQVETPSAPLSTTGGGAVSAFEVFDTDVLVIGGGVGGPHAALTAYNEGANVILVDKGPFRHSGSGGFNWGLCTSWAADPNAALTGDMLSVDGTAEQCVVKAAYEAGNEYNNLAKYVDHGCTLLNRTPDGNFAGWEVNGQLYSFDVFCRHSMDAVEESGITVCDRTMITQLLVQDGRCIGAIGLHLPSGTFRIFRAKQTVSSAGSAAWILGWETVSAKTTSGPDTTGDMTAIAYRNGCTIHQLEFADVDTIIPGPSGISHSYNAGLGLDPLFCPVFANSDGEHFLEQYGVGLLSRGQFIKEAEAQIKAGKGSPNGGIFLDLRDVNGEMSPYWNYLEYYYKRNIELLKDRFGIDARKDLVEVVYNIPDNYGIPRIDEHMQTEIPGLYFGRSLTNTPSSMTINTSIAAAKYAATQVMEGNVELSEEFPWDSVQEEFARLESILSKEAEDSLRPHEVRHMIQATAGEHLFAVHDDEGLQACIDELIRIRTEEMPRMAVSLKTKTFNMEWKEAIENYNMLDFAEMEARAMLMRKESRSSFVRTDYPERDDENWLCWVGVKMIDGEMTTETFPMDLSVVDAEGVKQMNTEMDGLVASLTSIRA